MGKRNSHTERLIKYYEAMVQAARDMPREEMQALLEWERKHVDGSGTFCTSDWPGWEKYIGKMPK